MKSVIRRIPRNEYPWWVKLSIWGVPGRAGLWAFVAVSVALAAVSGVFGFWDRQCFFGIAFLLAALPYWSSIRWIDRHGTWSEDVVEVQ